MRRAARILGWIAAALFCVTAYAELANALRDPAHWLHLAWMILGGVSFLLIAGALYTIYDSLRGRR